MSESEIKMHTQSADEIHASLYYRKCKTCKYYSGMGCHRHAPIIRDGHFLGCWPHVDWDHWCGDWEQKQTGGATADEVLALRQQLDRAASIIENNDHGPGLHSECAECQWLADYSAARKCRAIEEGELP